jgi:hypothetical protein
MIAFPTLSFAGMPKEFEAFSHLSEIGVEYKHGPSKELRIALQQSSCLLPTKLTLIHPLTNSWLKKTHMSVKQQPGCRAGVLAR